MSENRTRSTSPHPDKWIKPAFISAIGFQGILLIHAGLWIVFGHVPGLLFSVEILYFALWLVWMLRQNIHTLWDPELSKMLGRIMAIPNAATMILFSILNLPFEVSLSLWLFVLLEGVFACMIAIVHNMRKKNDVM